jgi:hypothetical protein
MALISHRAGREEATEGSGRSATATIDRPVVDNRRSLAERTAAATRTATTTPATTATGPRARASVIATMALMFGVTAALFVLTGVLAGAGVAIGMLAAFAGVGGIATTTRRHVTGKGNALLGLALGLAAVVIGTLSVTHSLSWLNPATNEVARMYEWIGLHLPWLVPSK